MEEDKLVLNKKAVVIGSLIAIIVIALAILIAVVSSHNNEINKIKQAVLDDCLLSPHEDYIIHIEKCEARSTFYPNATFYICWVYTEEAELETVFVRYMDGKAEVFEQ